MKKWNGPMSLIIGPFGVLSGLFFLVQFINQIAPNLGDSQMMFATTFGFLAIVLPPLAGAAAYGFYLDSVPKQRIIRLKGDPEL
jgi:hypothetical protein